MKWTIKISVERSTVKFNRDIHSFQSLRTFLGVISAFLAERGNKDRKTGKRKHTFACMKALGLARVIIKPITSYKQNAWTETIGNQFHVFSNCSKVRFTSCSEMIVIHGNGRQTFAVIYILLIYCKMRGNWCRLTSSEWQIASDW